MGEGVLRGVGRPLSVFLIAQHVPKVFISSGMIIFICASISSEESKLGGSSVGTNVAFDRIGIACDDLVSSSIGANVTRTSGVGSTGLASRPFVPLVPLLVETGCVACI